RDKIWDLLTSALASLKQIQTVVWEAHAHGAPSWAPSQRNLICHALNTYPTLHMLELNIQGSVDFSSLQVLGIRKIIIKSPGSVSHNLSMNYANELPIYHQVATLVSQNLLHCLHLDGPSKWSTVWRMLRTRAQASVSQVKLAEIRTSVVTSDLFAYLALYSGLEKLTLKSPDGGSREQTDRLADSFFNTTLPRHAASLMVLSCPAAYKSRFNFGTHNVDVLLLFRKLRTLEMSINAGAWVDADGNCYFVDSVSMAAILVEVEQANIDPIMTLLLETAATLPALRGVTIIGADTERNRGNLCRNGMLYHKGVVDVASERAVMAFRSKMPLWSLYGRAIVSTTFNRCMAPRRKAVQMGSRGFGDINIYNTIVIIFAAVAHFFICVEIHTLADPNQQKG
ncbi:hypothetical protein B0H14DRAFT_3657504, partial [Mycena olivaceomarginata]